MWTMGDYTPGSISQMLSGNPGEIGNKISETPKAASSAKKNVKFGNLSNEKKHKTYEKTPFSVLGKKKNKSDSPSEAKPEKRKLIFDEMDELVQSKKFQNSQKKKKSLKETVSNDNINEVIKIDKQPIKNDKRKLDNKNNLSSSKPDISVGNDAENESGKLKKKHKKNKKKGNLNKNIDNNEVVIKSNKRKFDEMNDHVESSDPKVNDNEDGNESIKKSKKRKKSKQKGDNENRNNKMVSIKSNTNNDLGNKNLKKLDHKINDVNVKNDSIPPNSTNEKFNIERKKHEDDPEKLERTIFVGNVPLNYTMQKVSSLFSQFGPVEKVRLRCVPVGKLGMSKKEAACTKEFHPNRKSMAAFVVFKSKESVRPALEQNGMLADDHHLRIDLADRKQHDSNKAVFVGGLPFDVEEDEVWEVFEKCGEIENVRIVRDNYTMIGKGFGYVNFTSSASVELALELDGQQIKNRKINVQRCMKVKKKKKFNKGENLNLKNKSENNVNRSKKSKKNRFNLNEVKVTAKQVASGTQFQGRKAGKDKKKKKNHKLSQGERRRRKMQKILAPSSGPAKK